MVPVGVHVVRLSALRAGSGWSKNMALGAVGTPTAGWRMQHTRLGSPWARTLPVHATAGSCEGADAQGVRTRKGCASPLRTRLPALALTFTGKHGACVSTELQGLGRRPWCSSPPKLGLGGHVGRRPARSASPDPAPRKGSPEWERARPAPPRKRQGISGGAHALTFPSCRVWGIGGH